MFEAGRVRITGLFIASWTAWLLGVAILGFRGETDVGYTALAVSFGLVVVAGYWGWKS
jgi:hypothetical protein